MRLSARDARSARFTGAMRLSAKADRLAHAAAPRSYATSPPRLRTAKVRPTAVTAVTAVAPRVENVKDAAFWRRCCLTLLATLWPHTTCRAAFRTACRTACRTALYRTAHRAAFPRRFPALAGAESRHGQSHGQPEPHAAACPRATLRLQPRACLPREGRLAPCAAAAAGEGASTKGVPDASCSGAAAGGLAAQAGGGVCLLPSRYVMLCYGRVIVAQDPRSAHLSLSTPTPSQSVPFDQQRNHWQRGVVHSDSVAAPPLSPALPRARSHGGPVCRVLYSTGFDRDSISERSSGRTSRLLEAVQ